MKITKTAEIGSTQNEYILCQTKNEIRNSKATLFAEISVGVETLFDWFPRVARSSRPWALLRNPVGIQGKGTLPKPDLPTRPKLAEIEG